MELLNKQGGINFNITPTIVLILTVSEFKLTNNMIT